jgi:hypothetical protein
MKRITFLIAISFSILGCYSQSKTSEMILGNWYHGGSNTLNIDVNESITFSKDSIDSLHLVWMFDKSGDYTVSFAMLTPKNMNNPDSHRDIIKYKSKNAKWILNDRDELIISEDSGDKIYKVSTLNANKLSVKRIS